jgi:hypothetical protein
MKQARMIQAVFEGNFATQLKDIFKPKFSNKTLKADQFLHHVTLFFERKPVDIETHPWGSIVDGWAQEGEDVFVYFKELVWSDTFGVEAVIVTLKNSKGEFLEAPENKIWHITVSTEGKPPVESNTLLNNRHDPSMRAESQKLNDSKLIAKIVHYK